MRFPSRFALIAPVAAVALALSRRGAPAMMRSAAPEGHRDDSVLAFPRPDADWKLVPLADGEPPLRALTFADGAAIAAAIRR